MSPGARRDTWNHSNGLGLGVSSDEGIVYVGSNDGNLYAINPDGTQKWAFSTGNGVLSSLAIGKDDTLYVGSDDGSFYAINSSSKGLQSDSPWPMFHHESQHMGQADSEDKARVGLFRDGAWFLDSDDNG